MAAIRRTVAIGTEVDWIALLAEGSKAGLASPRRAKERVWDWLEGQHWQTEQASRGSFVESGGTLDLDTNDITGKRALRAFDPCPFCWGFVPCWSGYGPVLVH